MTIILINRKTANDHVNLGLQGLLGATKIEIPKAPFPVRKAFKQHYGWNHELVLKKTNHTEFIYSFTVILASQQPESTSGITIFKRIPAYVPSLQCVDGTHHIYGWMEQIKGPLELVCTELPKKITVTELLPSPLSKP